MKEYTRMYLIAIVFLLVYILLEFIPIINQNEICRIFLLCGSCLFMYIGGVKLSKYLNNNKPMKINLVIFFVIYIVLLLTFTMFDPMWGRSGLNKIIDTNSFKIYIDNSLNLVPFKTISLYIDNLSYSILSKENIMFNLVGNFVCMMPLGLFLPLLFKKEQRFLTYLKTILCITLSIELVQFITTSGSCDIDDIILNASGAILFFGILNIPIIKRIIYKIFLREDIRKKELQD